MVPMIARAIDVSERLQEDDARLSVDQLCELTGYSRSTIYRILRTLAAFEYVVREPEGKYRWSVP
jgi:DNA-binding IclR family transcriptional regulator